jgi:phosphoglucosamine mutase
LRVVIDCGNGAATVTAPSVLSQLGAKVDNLAVGAQPDGTNINSGCGSTDPGPLQAEVVATGAAAGLAFDGDADRLVAVDERGGLVDGDHILAIAALDLRSRRLLRHNTVVATVMANLGFHQAMAAEGIRVETTPVGDRAVLEAMEVGGFSLGGEQSGHIIFGDLATTGDGLLSGLVLLDVLCRSGRPLSEVASVVRKLPQVLRNVRVADRAGLPDATAFWAEVAAVESELGAGGRVLVRPSGTEPLVRIMVEASTGEAATTYTDRLEAALTAALGKFV